MKRKDWPKFTKLKSQSGFSLVELLITCVIMLFVLAIMGTIVSGVQSSYRVYRERASKHEDALASLNLITRLIRNAGDNTTQTALTATGNNRLRIKSDWTNSDNSLDDAFEDVEFYVSNNTLYMMSNGSTSNTVEIAQNIQAITFSYFDSNGAITSTMTSVVRVNVTLTIAGESQSLTANASLRKMLQPK